MRMTFNQGDQKDPLQDLRRRNYNTEELDSLVRNYMDSNFAYRDTVMKLLLATSTFHCHIATGKNFKEMRDTKKSEEFQIIFDNIATAINLARGMTKKNNKHESEINAVIDYCLTSVKKRLAELDPDDKILIWYKENPGNALRTIIDPQAAASNFRPS